MLKTNKIKLIEQLSDELGIYFHGFRDIDDNTLVADSHFFKFIFGPNHVTVEDSYVLPGPDMQQYILENLPYQLEYTKLNFNEIFMEDIQQIHDNLIALEIREEEKFEEQEER